MSRFNRREFLGRSLTAAGIGAGFAIGGTKSSGRIIGANDTVRIAVAGLNGRGGSHVGEFAPMKNVAITYLVDPDTRTYKKRLDQLTKLERPAARVEKDIRKVLEDKSIIHIRSYGCFLRLVVLDQAARCLATHLRFGRAGQCRLHASSYQSRRCRKVHAHAVVLSSIRFC